MYFKYTDLYHLCISNIRYILLLFIRSGYDVDGEFSREGRIIYYLKSGDKKRIGTTP